VSVIDITYISPSDIENINVVKLLLTYMVPYFVTTYTAVTLKPEFIIGSHSPIETDLKCQLCHKQIHLKQG